MKILILYPATNQTVLMDSLCNNLNDLGLYADSFDTASLRLYSPQGHKRCIWVWLYKAALKLPRCRSFIECHFFHRLILLLAKDYDVINVQSLFQSIYSVLVPKFKNRGKKVVLTIWGTDFYYHINEVKWPEWQIIVFNACDAIQIATESVKNAFVNKLPQYKDKIRVVIFGNQHLDDLATIKKHPECIDYSFIQGDYQGKIIVTCGYNARSRHQHLKMIEALERLPRELQSKIFVVFPMTYLREEKYLIKIEDALKHVHFKYTMINQFMTESQLFSLRMMTDLYINIIESDVLSSSTQEHLFCNSIVIVGDWLPYDVLEENGIFYIKTSMYDMYDNIYYALINRNKLKMQCMDNPERLYKLTSWKSAKGKFKEMFEQLYSQQ